jgi:proline dehydrogenase
MDWTDPVIDMNRRKKQELFLCTAMVKKMVIEIVEEAPAASVVGMIMKKVVEEAAKTGMTEKIWKELENDEYILQRIVQKVEDRESRKMLEKAE